jgi:flavodoxin
MVGSQAGEAARTCTSLVVYESMYGNTHLVTDAIADGLRQADADVVVVPVDDATEDVIAGATEDVIAGADLVVVGGPTHAHGMSRTSTREAAVVAARKPESPLEIDADAEGPGLRDWFDSLDRLTTPAAAFDTRFKAPAALTGRASKGIAKRLRRHGCSLIAEPESFLVTKQDHLVDDEETRAREWGTRLAATMSSVH